MMHSLLRLEENRVLAHLNLDGRILDVGGDARSAYRTLIGGTHSYCSVNIQAAAEPDVIHDLEQPLPFTDHSFDHALLVNVLEHVFNFQQLLHEIARVVKSGGSVVIVVPFLFPVHPSPHDYWRFSKEALERECRAAGLRTLTVEPLGTGVFAARYVALDRLMPEPIRLCSFYTVRYASHIFDTLFTAIARSTRRKYDPADYALGYVVQATK